MHLETELHSDSSVCLCYVLIHASLHLRPSFRAAQSTGFLTGIFITAFGVCMLFSPRLRQAQAAGCFTDIHQSAQPLSWSRNLFRNKIELVCWATLKLWHLVALVPYTAAQLLE